MMKSWRLGTIFGFPVDLNLSFLLLLGLVFVAFGGLAGVVLVCLAFASVLLHELGHALVARRLGVRVSGIELVVLRRRREDGPAAAHREPRARDRGRGPGGVARCSAALGLGLAALLARPAARRGSARRTSILAGFNLIPALPMDGGRILRALLTRKMDFVRATDVSVKVARVVAVGVRPDRPHDAARTSCWSSRRSCGSWARASRCWPA